MKTKFGLIRHGTTDWNIERRIQGWSDIPLNARGRREVSILAKTLKGQDWEFIITSDLKRAKETGRIIGDHLEIPFFTFEGLRERKFGPVEGMAIGELRAAYPDSDGELLLPGLESRQEINERALTVMNLLAVLFHDRRILIVSHGGFLRAFFLSLGLNRKVPENAEMIKVTWEGSWSIL